ncbi:MAG: AraC family transcriptional regulator [Pseudomonadota bacterium]
MAGVNLIRTAFPAGGGGFELPRLALGVFLIDQPTHHIAIGSDKRAHRPLKKHDGWLLPASSNGLCEFEEPLDALIIDFDPDLLKDVGLHNPTSIAPYAGRLDPLTLQLALQAENFATAPTLYRETMSRALAAQIIHTKTTETPAPGKIDDHRLNRVVDYIHDRLADDLSLKDLADIAAMSPFHFSRAFKAATGHSPLQYLIGCRMDRAKVLLRTTKLTVAEIAYRTGYEDAGRFSQHFKKRVGVRPSAYREG